MLKRIATFVPIILLTLPSAETAATIEKSDGSSYCSLHLDGLFEKGDAARVETALKAIPMPDTVNICLSSSGGSYQEALKIAELILEADRSIRTVVDRGAECYSACALVFMAGHTARPDPKPQRAMHVRGVVGFHAPTIRHREDAYDPTVVARAHREGLKAINQLLKLNAIEDIEVYPEKLIAQFLQKRPDEFLFVDTVQKAGLWGIDLFGYKKPDKLSTLMVLRACNHRLDWGYNAPVPNDPSVNDPVPLKDGKRRLSLPDYGDEGAFLCVVDIYDDSTGKPYLDVVIASEETDKEVREPDSLGREVKAIVDPLAVVGVPLWYTLLLDTQIKDIGED